jgi:ABC-2 type transport system permease protein
MSPFLALVRKQLTESRWLLGLTAAALCGLSWLTVFITSLTEARMRKSLGGDSRGLRTMAFRGVGGAIADLASVAFEVAWWNHPFILTNVLLWAILRGSGAVSSEIERGTLDLVLSRPISRFAYLASQVATGLFGLLTLSVAIVAGNVIAGHWYPVETPPTWASLLRPAVNMAALGFAVYGYTLLLSAIDSVRWRPNLIASVLTLGGYVALVIANVPVLEDWRWLGNLSIFKAYDPVSAAVTGEHLVRHTGILAGIGLGGVVLGFLGFLWRDLPANS